MAMQASQEANCQYMALLAGENKKILQIAAYLSTGQGQSARFEAVSGITMLSAE
jgi:hypothetical protein